MMTIGHASTKINDFWGQLHKIIPLLSYNSAALAILYIKLILKVINIYCYEANVRQGT